MRADAIFARRWIAKTVLVIAVAALCVRLGIWQLDRLGQRRAFNDHVTFIRALPILALPTGDDLETQEYRWVRVLGSYDHERQVALRNQAHEGQYGFHLITPLRIEDPSGAAGERAVAILVDRGWIPGAGNDRRLDWRKYDQAGEVEALGVIRLGHNAPLRGGMAQPAALPPHEQIDHLLYVDLDQISQQLPYAVLPVYLQLDRHENTPDLPLAAAPIPELTEGPHLGYAMQWFAFGAILVVGYPFYVGKQEAGRV